MIQNNTINPKDSIIFHIPHSGTIIPDYTGFNLDLIDDQMKALTDHNTQDIFNVNGIDSIIFPYSRLFCDVERFPDEQEPMFLSGHGFYYTKTNDGKELRTLENKDNVLKYYNTHHNILTNKVKEKLDINGACTIIDCHSFNNDFFPFKTPDICIGTDDFHTPKFLIDKVIHTCKKFGFSYDTNTPYEGTIIPASYYKTNNMVNGIMIEINKKLYMDNNSPNYFLIHKMNQFINQIFI